MQQNIPQLFSLKIKEPGRVLYRKSWLLFIIYTILFVGLLGVLWHLSGGDVALAVQTVRQGLADIKQESVKMYLCLLFLMGFVLIAPFMQGWELMRNYRQLRGKARPLYLDFDPAGVSVRFLNASHNLFFPYQQTDFSFTVWTYIRRGSKGAKHRSISNISCTLTNGQTYRLIEHVGNMRTITHLLDMAPRFRSFVSDVRTVESFDKTDPDERDLVQYVKEQIYNYQTYGKMLRYTNKQRKEVRNSGYLFMGLAILFSLSSLPLALQISKDIAKDPAILFFAFPLFFIPLGLFAAGWYMWFLARNDAKTAQLLRPPQTR